MTPLANIAPAPIQSGEDLAAEYADLMRITRREFVEKVATFTRTINVDALRTYASREMGSECTNVYHIATGGFNAIYFLAFLDGREAITRVNMEVQTSDQTLLRDRLLSEASTLRYVKKHCSVPVPNIYIVEHHKPNPVGARFVIEERVLGRQMILSAYTPSQRKEVLTKVFHCEAEFIRTQFTAIGSVYHCLETDTFYVGPMGPSVCRPLNHTIDRGPWTSTRDWLKAYVKSELAGIQNDPENYRKQREVIYRLDNGNAPFAYHVAWLETLLATIDKLQYLHDIPAAVERPVLCHEDLSAGNILVSYPNPTDLAGIIDFEGARIIPLWSAMSRPACIPENDPVETELLMKTRLEILCQADPACAQAESYRALRPLRFLASMGVTMWCSIEELHQYYEEMKTAWPIEEPAFAALDELVALGPAGYAERGAA